MIIVLSACSVNKDKKTDEVENDKIISKYEVIIDGFYEQINSLNEKARKAEVDKKRAEEFSEQMRNNIREMIHALNSGTQMENKKLTPAGRCFFNPNVHMTIMRFNNQKLFITPSSFIDIDTMTLKEIAIPDGYRAFRPPYSNNMIPLIKEYKYYEYNIDEKTITELDTNFYVYNFFNSDRAYVVHEIYAPNYSLVCTSGGWSMALDGEKRLYDSSWGEDPQKISEYILETFSGTVFDNEYILETIATINELMGDSRAVITKDDTTIGGGDILPPILNIGMNNYLNLNFSPRYKLLYLLRRLEIYFGQNIFHEFVEKKQDYSSWETSDINIYCNGFYILNIERIILMDLRSKKFSKYDFDESIGLKVDIDKKWPTVTISDDARYLYLIVRGINGNNDGYVYKYRL